MRRTVALLSCLSIIVCAAFATAEEADWPGWRGPNRDGKSDATGLNTNWEQTPPKLKYMSSGLGKGYASLSIGNGRIYTSGNLSDGQAVIALDQQTGAKVWSTLITSEVPKHGYTGSRTTPTIDGDHLYVVASNGAAVCLNSKDGEIVWKREFKDFGGKMMSGWGFSESPLVDGDLMLCTPGGKDAMIVALNKMTGKEVWRSAMPDLGSKKQGAGYSSIVISNAGGVKQYVQLVGQGVIGVRASDGEYLWGYADVANGTANIPTPIIDGDFVFASSGYGTGAALVKIKGDGVDKVSAEEIYFLKAKTLQNHHGGLVLVDGHVYGGHGHGRGMPICVEMKTGKVVWGGDIRGEGSGSAAVLYADGHLIFRYQSGEVALMEATPKGYQLKGVLKPEYQEDKSWAHPVIVDGLLYLREQDKLMCYDISDKS